MLRRTSKAGQPERDAFDAAAHILVVNDDEGACELLCRLLVRAGHRVQRAHNAEQALGQLSIGKISCVVLDLATGGIGANLKLLDTIRSSMTPATAAVRVVLVAPQTSNRMFSWEAGIDAFLVRPFHANELLRQVDDVLERPEHERVQHRRHELDVATTAGRAAHSRTQ